MSGFFILNSTWGLSFYGLVLTMSYLSTKHSGQDYKGVQKLFY